MIICFSGTGNSRYVADMLQDALGDELVRLPPGLMRTPSRIKIEVYDSRVIWIMPVHCWGMPRTVEQVLSNAKLFGKTWLTHHLILTCGDDIGYADRQWRSILKKRGWKTGSVYTVQMPNTYTFMKGFDVDSPEVAKAKMDAVPARVERIAHDLDWSDKEITDVVRGKWPWFKTHVIYPWFMRRMTRTTPFHATDACKSCGRCARNCPLSIIAMKDGHPEWRIGHCTMCLRCYHNCPVHAVAYGKATDGKGQYVCEGYTLKN